MKSTLRLFKALPINNKSTASNAELMRATLADGFIFTPEVIANYPDTAKIRGEVKELFGRGSVELNQTFHKSFAKVRDASIQQLVLEQIIHYMSTYGAERMGVYSEESVYIPGEVLEAPELKDGVRIVVIRGLTREELKTELLKLLGPGVALHEQTVADAVDVAQFVGMSPADIEAVKNKEVKAALYDYFGVMPSQPVEFLRFVVYRATEKTLLIKNRELVGLIKGRNNNDIVRYFDIYEREVGLSRLSEIFYRYKPLFLAFRTNSSLKRSVNKIRRLAVANHKPMPEDLLNTITPRMKTQSVPEVKYFNEALRNASIFRRARLAYALKFRTTDADSVLYRVRNGKSYAKEFSFDNKTGAQAVLNVVLLSIVNDLRPNVEGKKIFIPEGMKYALPSTEKQFTGEIPSGSFVEVPQDMVVGVHWENQKGYRVDLDMSLQNAGGKIGWNASYRDSQNGIYYSGDVTSAPLPRGATEAFHVGSGARGSWILFANYYNFNADVEVPIRVLVASEKRSDLSKNHTVNPNNIVALAHSSIKVKMKSLGLVVADDDSTRFYFAEGGLGNTNVSRNTAYTEQARKFLLSYYKNSIVLNDLLVQAGAVLVTAPEEADIDMSPEALTKTTILDLLQKQ